VPTTDDLLGPLGLTVAALFAAGWLSRMGLKFFTDLWATHKQDDARNLERLDESEERLDATLVLLRDMTDVTERSVAVSEASLAELRGNRDGRR